MSTGHGTIARLLARGSRGRGARRGIALVEAVISLAIFVMLVGSVAYASRIALSVMSESMNETKLLFRVRRALDQVEEQLSRCCSVSVVTLTESGWSLVGLENWFEQLSHQNEGEPVSEPADDVRFYLEESRRALEEGPPDFTQAEASVDRAIEEFEDMVGGGLIDPGDVDRLREGLDQVRTFIRARDLLSLGGNGTGAADGWLRIEQTIADRDSLVAAEPLIAADEVLFRQIVLGPDGPEYRPPLDEPPNAYYLRPMADGELFELVYYDGTRTIVIASRLTGATFDLEGATLRITLFFEEERSGAVIVRTEVRSIILRVP